MIMAITKTIANTIPKAIKYIFFLLLIIVIGLAIYIGVQPNSYEVTRSRDIAAPAAVIYDNVIDYKNWQEWNSWVEADPEMTITYPDKTEGVGGSYQWEDKDGVGTMTTLEAKEDELIKQQMQFAEFPPSDISWAFTPKENGAGTSVTWTIEGKDLPFMFKAFSTFMGGMEKQIAPHFERGLEKLDSVVVASMDKYEVNIEGIKEYGGGFYLYKTTNADASNISSKMGEHYGSIGAFMGQNNIQMTGMPLTVYLDMNQEDGTVIMSNGLPVSERITVPPGSDIQCGYIPKTAVLKASLNGNYNHLEKAWGEAMAYIEKNGLQTSELKPFEIYTNDPGDFPNPADWRTEIFIPIIEQE